MPEGRKKVNIKKLFLEINVIYVTIK